MYNFNIIEKFDQMYKGKHPFKERELSILEFNARVLELARDDNTPIIERLRFIEIVFNNLDEFISVKLSDCKEKYRRHYIIFIQKLYEIMEDIFTEILKSSTLKISESKMEYNPPSTCFRDGGLYYVYIDNKDNFNVVPLTISKNLTEQRIKILQPGLEIKFSFMLRFISDKTFTYLYTGENTHEILNEIKSLVKIKDNNVFNYVQTTCNNPLIMSNFLKQMSIDIDEYIYIGEALIQIKGFMKRVVSINDDPSLYYPKFISEYSKLNYSLELIKRDILIYNPYESYSHITDFINEMCISENIKTIFCTLYRTAENSVIVDSLINAKNAGKSVYVYVEPTARGNEERNITLIERLISSGVHVSCNYYNYKVHSKLFCAVDKNGVVYTHVGTGNYNESTAKVYTDIHLLTSNPLVTMPALKIFMCLFKKKIYFPDDSLIDGLLFASPINLREEILRCIGREMRKKEKGKIYIKCNSLCDLQVIHKLYEASKVGVDIKLIVRTASSILPNDNIKIRSKVGRFLEHDRIYIFGNDAYISSADLLLRNINKRVEILCKLIDSESRLKVFDIFSNVWNDEDIQYIGKDFKWHSVYRKEDE